MAPQHLITIIIACLTEANLESTDLSNRLVLPIVGNPVLPYRKWSACPIQVSPLYACALHAINNISSPVLSYGKGSPIRANLILSKIRSLFSSYPGISREKNPSYISTTEWNSNNAIFD